MIKKILTAGILAFALCSCTQASKTGVVSFVDDAANKKVDVIIDGKLFTSYIYPDDMEKQSLYPIFTASGQEITRGYPLNPRPFERIDHPHHVGMWFNFGDVNGLDFWNNSFAIPAEKKNKYGSIKFKGISEMDSTAGKLVVTADWVNSGDTVLMSEQTTYIFSGNDSTRMIERITTLTAQTDVTFTENKEGMLGIRMDRAFEEPSDKPQKFTDANGIVTEVPSVNNDGVNGVYHNAEGDTGEKGVWSKKSPWVSLKAMKNGKPISVTVFDNKNNIGYPAWSHARGYGLFATNNMGGRAFDPNTDEMRFTLKPGESITFKYKVLIGGDIPDEELNKIAESFN